MSCLYHLVKLEGLVSVNRGMEIADRRHVIHVILKEYLVMFDNFSQNKTFFFLDIFSLNKNSRLYI